MGRQSVSGIRRKVARGLQNLQASRRLSLLRFMGIQSVRPCTLLQPFSLSPPDAPAIAAHIFLKMTGSGLWQEMQMCRHTPFTANVHRFCLSCPVIAGDVFMHLFFLLIYLFHKRPFINVWLSEADADRLGGGQTDRQALRQVSFRLDETCSKPHISLALQSYWTLKLSSLHRALWIRPQSGDRGSVGL